MNSSRLCLILIIVSVSTLTSCGTKVVSETRATPADPPKPPPSVQMWLGSPSRSFYGTGPWTDEPLQVFWEFKTSSISGRLHKDPWGGTSWPGQPSVDEHNVFYPSADGNVYCLNVRDGSLVWKFKAEDSFKATPVIAGNRIIASGLDHYIYCINRKDGTLLWKYKTGFEVDCGSAVIDGKVYFGGEDGFFYCLNLEDGSAV